MKKKVLFLNLTTFSRTGGIEKFNRSFLKALHELEKRKLVYSNAHSLYDEMPDTRYYPTEKYTGYKQKTFEFIFQSLRKARRYDCIVLGHVNLAIIGMLIKVFYPKKEVLIIIHGIEVWDGLSPVKKQLLERADKILSVSTYTRDKLIELEHIRNRSIDIFPNTIDPYFPAYRKEEEVASVREKYKLTESDFVLFTLTRLSSKEKYKGYDIVIECLGEICSNYKQVKYVIAGKYDEEEKTRIESLISDLGLKDKVTLAGFIKEEEIYAHYCMSDLFIMPSQKEGFGIVFIEALASGVPVVAGNMDGSVDALMNGELGVLVNPESKEEITQAIINAVNSMQSNKNNQAQELQQKTLSNFGFRKFTERLEHVLCASN